uniref:Uncharacterized protein n=1 Tax=Sparus aurata TaxID=8175 RepID=A0A671YLP4_SPAAU
MCTTLAVLTTIALILRVFQFSNGGMNGGESIRALELMAAN